MKLTPTERRIFELLRSDGLPHIKAELLALIDDELAGATTLPAHLSNLRKKLAAEGWGVAGISFVNGVVTHYQLMQTGNPFPAASLKPD